MYADRLHRPGLQPGSLAVSLGITGAMIAGLIFSAPDIVTIIKHGPITTIDVTLPHVPPPDPKPQLDKPQPTQRAPIDLPRTLVPTEPVITLPHLDLPPAPPLTDGNAPMGVATATPEPVASPPALPVLVAATIDPRFADALQPPYPAAEARAEHEGAVTVLVTIGVDGRVKRIECVAAGSDEFFHATERQALAHWRFRPATRGGIPVESTKTMTVHFVLKDA